MSVNRFSPHPSNPLEVGSSDVVNRNYKAQLQAQRDAQLSTATSDDPMDVIPKYQSHLAEVVPGYLEVQVAQEDVQYVDLDSEESDDLQALGQDDTPRKATAAPRRLVDYNDDDEDMESEEEQEEEEEGEEEVVIKQQQRGDVTRMFDDDDEEDEEDEQGLGLGEDDEDEDEEMHQDWEGCDDEDDYDDDFHRTSDDMDCFALDESEEESSIKSKPEDEQAEILQEIQDFKRCLPQLEGNYKLIDRLGTGTFSSVYKAIDLRYHEYDNAPWLGNHPPDSSAHFQSVPKPEGSRVFVAIKRIYVTSGPERIKNELLLMELCRGCRHISQLITAFRHHDQIAIVMPYQRNDDFRDFFTDLPMPAIKEYFRCLMRALRDIHQRQIIHRDVKPANFLFDPRTGQGSLCDFGLAQRFHTTPPAHGACLHTTMSRDYPHGKIIHRNEYDPDMVKRRQSEARAKSKAKPESVGYPDKDTRGVLLTDLSFPMKANRAGTRGFRAPEVLFKCGQQNGAVDVWSAGIILLFFLTRKFPLFQSNDDIEALMEIATILGKVKMEKVATLHCRTFSTNVPGANGEETSWKTFAEKLNPDLRTMPPPNLKFYPYTLPSQKAKLVLEAEAENALADSKVDKAKDKAKDEQKVDESNEANLSSNSKSNLEKGTSGSPPRKPEVKQEEEKGNMPNVGVAMGIAMQPEGGRRSSMAVDPPPPLTIDLRNGNPLLGEPEEREQRNPSSRLTPINSPMHHAAADDADETLVGQPLPTAGEPAAKAEEVDVERELEQEQEEQKPVHTGPTPEEVYQRDVDNALDLLEKLLHPESVRRITPRDALYHPFLAERVSRSSHIAPDTDDPTHAQAPASLPPPPRKPDDDYVPAPFGEGICKSLHFVDEVTEVPGVIVRGCVCGCGQSGGCVGEWEEVRRYVSAGEGLTIGSKPCEFHVGYEF